MSPSTPPVGGTTGPKRPSRVRPAFDPEHDEDNVLETVAKDLGFLDTIRAHPIVGWIYRAVVGLVGGAVIVVGLILIPLPGPGWLIVFAGLGILSTEFDWAKRLLDFAREKVGAWTRWIMVRPLWVRALVGALGVVLLLALLLAGLRAAHWHGFPFD